MIENQQLEKKRTQRSTDPPPCGSPFPGSILTIQGPEVHVGLSAFQQEHWIFLELRILGEVVTFWGAGEADTAPSLQVEGQEPQGSIGDPFTSHIPKPDLSFWMALFLLANSGRTSESLLKYRTKAAARRHRMLASVPTVAPCCPVTQKPELRGAVGPGRSRPSIPLGGPSSA